MGLDYRRVKSLKRRTYLVELATTEPLPYPGMVGGRFRVSYHGMKRGRQTSQSKIVFGFSKKTTVPITSLSQNDIRTLLQDAERSAFGELAATTAIDTDDVIHIELLEMEFRYYIEEKEFRAKYDKGGNNS